MNIFLLSTPIAKTIMQPIRYTFAYRKTLFIFPYMFRPSSYAVLMLTNTGCSENEVQSRTVEHPIEEITAKWRQLRNEDITIHSPHKIPLGHQLEENEMGRRRHIKVFELSRRQNSTRCLRADIHV